MRTKKTVILCFVISLLTGFFGAALRTMALLVYYSMDSGHFTKGDAGIIPELGWGICVVGLLVCAFLCFMHRKKLKNYEKINGSLYTVASTLLVCAVLCVFFESFAGFLNGNPDARAVNIIISVGAVISCVVLFTDAFFPIKGIDPLRAAISLVPAVFVVLPAYRLYFDPELVMNCPNKNVYIIAACFAAAMVIYECRFYTELRNTPIYVTCCCGALIFGMFCGIPNVVFSAVYDGASVINSLATDLLALGFAVFAAIQLVSIHRTRKKYRMENKI